MPDLAYAGHAGEGGMPVMPHEIMEGLSVVGGLVLLGLALSGYLLWRIVCLERRLQAVESMVHSDRFSAGS
jgi:hypothetical protein